MIFLAVLLTAVGVGDVLRSLVGETYRRLQAIFLGLIALLAASGLGFLLQGDVWVHTLLVIGLVLSLLLWWWSVPVGAPTAREVRSLTRKRAERSGRTTEGLRGHGLLLISVFLVVGFMVCQQLMTPAPEWQVPRAHGLAAQDLLLGLGVVLFLMMSSNALVRGALSGEVPADSEAMILQKSPALKGGRWIGPLERITLAGLLLAGAYPVAAGLMAAKGIVRFPEMQADRENGNLAEYFLVGSLVSWTLAMGAAALMWWSTG